MQKLKHTAAVAAIDGYFQTAQHGETGQFLMPLLGVLDDPFAGMA